MKKKILYISLRSGYGGATTHIDQLIENFNAIYNVYCAAPLEKPYGEKWNSYLGSSNFLELPYRSFSIKYFFRLSRFIKHNKIDIIHAHGKGAGIYARLAKIFHPKLYVIFTFHGLHIESYSRIMKLIYIFIERLLGKLTNQFINVSHGEKKRCIDNNLFSKEKSIVIYNSIEKDENIYPAKMELRNKLNLPIDKFLVISVLRFDKAKNIPAMLQIAKFLTNNKNILFILLGDGEEKLSVEMNIAENNLDNIKLLGYKDNVLEYLQCTDVFISTSFWEGLPYSLLEAARAGIPIIASNVTGNNEVVFNNKNGYLFEIDDIEAASKLIIKLENSKETLETFGKNSKLMFQENFLLTNMIDKLKKVYSNIT